MAPVAACAVPWIGASQPRGRRDPLVAGVSSLWIRAVGGARASRFWLSRLMSGCWQRARERQEAPGSRITGWREADNAWRWLLLGTPGILLWEVVGLRLARAAPTARLSRVGFAGDGGPTPSHAVLAEQRPTQPWQGQRQMGGRTGVSLWPGNGASPRVHVTTSRLQTLARGIFPACCGDSWGRGTGWIARSQGIGNPDQAGFRSA